MKTVLCVDWTDYLLSEVTVTTSLLIDQQWNSGDFEECIILHTCKTTYKQFWILHHFTELVKLLEKYLAENFKFQKNN